MSEQKYKFDPKNARRHPAESKSMIKKSLQEVGAFRSIGVDGDGVVRAGNGVYEQALALGLEIIEVEAGPNQLIAVKRPDLTGDAAVMAGLYDNRASELSKWDSSVLADILSKTPKIHAAVFSVEDAARYLAATAPGEAENHENPEGSTTTPPAPEMPLFGLPGEPGANPFAMIMGQIKHQPKWNKKRSLRFLSFRVWRESTKQIDMGILKEAKQACRLGQIELVAHEISEGLKDMLKVTSGFCVTNPPRGASKGYKHFASEVASMVADLLGAEYFEAFESRVETGRKGRTSHPRNFRERGEIELKEIPSSPFVILIDDVATSATTLEQCSDALAGKGYAVIPVAWIYENEEN